MSAPEKVGDILPRAMAELERAARPCPGAACYLLNCLAKGCCLLDWEREERQRAEIDARAERAGAHLEACFPFGSGDPSRVLGSGFGGSGT